MSLPNTYDRKECDQMIPGIMIEIYQSRINADDVLFSAPSACQMLGLSRNWLSVALKRPSTVRQLEARGFTGSRIVSVAVANSSTAFTKPCRGLTRSDFNALTDHAASVGKLPAIALKRTFMMMGLLSIAGLNGKYQEQFRVVFAQNLKELEAKNASK